MRYLDKKPLTLTLLLDVPERLTSVKGLTPKKSQKTYIARPQRRKKEKGNQKSPKHISVDPEDH